MKFLNDQIIILNTYNRLDPKIERFKLTEPTSGWEVLQDSNLLDDDVWYCMFTNQDSFKIFDITQILGDNINKVIEKTAVMVLDMPFEPFLESIDSIYEDIVIKHGIPASQVVFQSNMRDANSYNMVAAEKYNQPPINIFWFSSLEVNYSKTRLSHVSTPSTLAVKPYNKKFLNLNRRWRFHRPLLVLLLYHKKLLDSGFVSFGPVGEKFNTWEEIWAGLKVSAIENPEMLSIIEQSESIKTMPPLYLDKTDLKINWVDLESSTYQFYQNSYFSVISETTFYYRDTRQNSRFITEKTFKAILMSHPFIIVSIPKSLEVLKELGYKTFSPWIDESYDQEMNDNKRMLMIVNEIKRLCNLSPIELVKFLVAIKDICSYNYNVLRNKKTFLYKL